MQKKVAIFLAEGFEEIEAVTVIDFLRRAEIPAFLVSITEELQVKGGHGLRLQADLPFSAFYAQAQSYSALVTPGGMQGVENLCKHTALLQVLKDCLLEENERCVAAICASPLFLQKIQLNKHFEGTCYPSLKEQVDFLDYHDQALVSTPKLITSQGPATSIAFSLALVERLSNKETAEKLAKESLYTKFFL